MELWCGLLERAVPHRYIILGLRKTKFRGRPGLTLGFAMGREKYSDLSISDIRGPG
jgi:hypothetical protein